MRQTLEDIRRKLNERVYRNEEHVRLSLVARILNDLGWDLWNPIEFNTEFIAIPNEDSTRVDVALFITPYAPMVYIEVKAIGRLQGNIGPIELQLRDYNRNNTAIFSVMTDGRRWRFYYSQTGGEFAQKCFKTLDLVEDDIEEVEVAFRTFLSKTELDNGNAKRNAEAYLQLSQKQRVIEDILPQAKRLVLEPPYPSLPQAVVELAIVQGLRVTLEEAAQFIDRFSLRRSITESVIPTQTAVGVQKERPKRSDTPMALADVLDVCHEVFENGKEYRQACAIVTQRRNLDSPHTVPDKCTRRIGLDTAGFKKLLENRTELIEHLIKYYPNYAEIIHDALG